MPAEVTNVNLLETDAMDESPLGRIVSWAVTVGRYIMITTEIVVLLAFISRFSLDRKVTDLNESINQKKAIVEANRDFENEFNSTKQKIAFIKGVLDTQEKPVKFLEQLRLSLPPDVYLDQLNISGNLISGEAIAGTISGFASFIYNLQSTEGFREVTLGEIKKQPLKGIVFTFQVSDKTKNVPVIKPAVNNNQTQSDKRGITDGI